MELAPGGGNTTRSTISVTGRQSTSRSSGTSGWRRPTTTSAGSRRSASRAPVPPVPRQVDWTHWGCPAQGTYAYDGAGDRVSKTVGAATTAYTLDLASGLPRVLSETTGSATTSYAYAARPLEIDQSGTTYWYLSDTLRRSGRTASTSARQPSRGHSDRPGARRLPAVPPHAGVPSPPGSRVRATGSRRQPRVATAAWRDHSKTATRATPRDYFRLSRASRARITAGLSSGLSDVS